MSLKTKNSDSENTDTDVSVSPTPLFGHIFDEPDEPEPDSCNEPIFPIDSLNVVSTKLRALQWSIPVEPDGALEKVLLACNKLAELGGYESCPQFNQFFARDAVSLFTKLLDDAAGQNWDDMTNHYIFTHCLLTIRVFALLAESDMVYVFYVAEQIFNPHSHFQNRCSQNFYRKCVVRFGSMGRSIRRFSFIFNLLPELGNSPMESDLRTYASPDCSETLHLMFDFINLFGRCGGFDNLLRRFKCLQSKPLSVPLIYTYLRPFKLCSYLLDDSIKKEYIVPIVDIVLDVFKCITEADIHQLFRNDQRSSHLTDFAIIRLLNFCVDDSTYSQTDIDNIHLDLIFKTMNIDLFGAKMSALTEIINNIQGAEFNHGNLYIAKESIFTWLRENRILSNLLHENLHQPQYVQKVTRIVRFLLEGDKLTLNDLDDIWKAQVGRHDIIAQNVESLIIQSVKYFTREHLDQLFDSFKTTVLESTKQQQERVIRLIPRLVAEDPEGLAKSATFLWELSIRPCLPPDISSAALKAHYEVLNTAVTKSGSEYLVEQWLHDFADIIKNNADDYAVDFAARQMIKTFRLLGLTIRYQVLSKFASMGIIKWCINGLRKYVDKYISVSRVAHDPGIESISSHAPSTTSTLSRGEATATVINALESTSLPVSVKPSGEPFHTIPFSDQLRDRLDLIHFLATESEENLTRLQLDQLWKCLIVDTEMEHETSSFTDIESLVGSSSNSDTLEGRNLCFKWFSPATNILVHSCACSFFNENVMKIKPEMLTPAGMDLFKCFFEFVNKEDDIATQSETLFGLDYLWNIVLVANDRVARVGIEMLRELFMKNQRSGRGLIFIKKCSSFLSSSYNKILENIRTHGVAHADGSLCRFYNSALQEISSTFMRDAEQDLMVIDRVIRVLRCFLMESDRNFMVLRSRLPLFHSWCGSTLAVKVNFEPVLKGSNVDRELIKLGANRGMQYRPITRSIAAHANETLGSLHRRLLVLCLAEIIPSLNSRKVTSKGDETEANFESIVDEFGLIMGNLGDISPNMNISTYGIMASHDSVSFDEDLTILITFNVKLCIPVERSQAVLEMPEDFVLAGIPSKNDSCSSSLGNCSSSSSAPPRPSTQGEGVKFDSPALELDDEDQLDGADDSVKNSISRSSLLGSSRNSSKADPVYEEPFDSSGEIPKICSESLLPDYVISEDQNFVRLLFDVGNVAVFLGVDELRDRIFDVLFSLPINLAYQEALQKCFASQDEMSKLQGLFNSSLSVLDLPCSSRQSFDDFEHGGITQQLYFLQIIYATLYPSPSDTGEIIFPKETFVHMRSFLQNGGLSILLSASILQDSKSIPANPLSQLVFLWLCRVINLCLYCSLHSLEVALNRDNLVSQRLSDLWQSAVQGELTLCDFIMQTYVEAFSDFASVTGVDTDEILAKWLRVPPQSCERLREAIWMINSVHSSFNGSLPLSSDSEVSSGQLNVKLAASHDSGCISPRTVYANHPTPSSVSCTFSTTCGLKPAALQTFFQIGRSDADLFSSDCVTMLLPNKMSVQPNPSVIPSLLALQSGRTPGCLSTCAISALTFLLALCPDSNLTALLQKNSSSNLNSEVAEGWLNFFRSILFQSSSLHLRHFASHCAHVVLSSGFVPSISDISDRKSVSATEISEFLLKYLIQTINEADSDSTLHCSNAVDLILSILRTLFSRNHIPSSLSHMFIDEWKWLLKKIKIPRTQSTERMDSPSPIHFAISDLLRSHLRLCTSLVAFQDPRLFNPDFGGHIDFELLDAIMSMLFPAAVRHAELVCKPNLAVSESTTSGSAIMAVCKALAPPPPTVADAAFDLLSNLLFYSPAHFVPRIADQLTTLLFTQAPVSFSWNGVEDGISPSPQGIAESNAEDFSDVPLYVGLKNPGSLCYMNAVLQQVFAILPIRNAVLSAPVLKILKEAGINTSALYSAFGSIRSDMDESKLNNLCSLFGLQDMFAFLAYTRQTFYEPTQFWKHFKLWGTKTTYNEQHDAQEFFSCFVDTIDQAMSLCGMPKVIEQYLGGTFADQKECISCHQVYSREESFLAISVDIQNRSSLSESLEEYVKSDLLEGNDAYFCEKCNEKVTARKRTCVKRLPQILTIHLKRFIYDYERGAPEKWDDYFSFPMSLDMAPYTVEGVASRDDSLEGSSSTNGSESQPVSPADITDAGSIRRVTQYVLRGVVVHSGRASGGHYFSYIRHIDQKTGKYIWHLFNDAKVSEVDLDSPATIQEKWFGGVNSASYNFSMSYYRHWSAYMLFYEREDFRGTVDASQLCHSFQSLSLSEMSHPVSPCPAHIASKIYAQDVQYFNQKAITSSAFRNFMSGLADTVENSGARQNLRESREGLNSLATLIFHYCFDMYFRLKDCDWLKWFKPLLQLLGTEPSVRKVFADITVFSKYNSPHDIFFTCPNAAIRFVYSTLLFLVLCHNDNQNGSGSLSEQILQRICKELPNCFYSLDDMYEDVTIGPQNINDSYWPSLHDSVRNLLKGAPGGQLLALLLDYLQVRKENIDRLGVMGLHKEMIKLILSNIPRSRVGTRKLTETTADLPESDPFEGSWGQLRALLGPDFVTYMRESAGILLIADLAKQQKTSDSDPALSFLPHRNSSALIAVGETKAHLFQLSLPLAVYYSPLNYLLKCLLTFFQRAGEADSCLDIEEILADINFSAFIKVILNNCLNQGSAMTIVGLLSTLMKDVEYRSRIVLEALTITIFNQFEVSSHTRVLVDLAISILLELLTFRDSLWEQRMLFVFNPYEGIDLLTKIEQHAPSTPLSSGMRVLQAIASVTSQNSSFNEFFCHRTQIGSRFRELINTTLGFIIYASSFAAQHYQEVLHETLTVLPELEKSAEDEETSSQTLSANLEEGMAQGCDQSPSTPPSVDPE
ncbi:hypothetical protein Aperf_G00000000943 [Anoplocephala perfoliata]